MQEKSIGMIARDSSQNIAKSAPSEEEEKALWNLLCRARQNHY